MRAHRDPGLDHAGQRRGGGKVGDHVVASLLLADHVGLQRHRDARNGKARHVRVAAVEFLLHCVERLAGRRHDRRERLATDAGRGNTGAGNRGIEAHGNHGAGIGRVWAGDDDHAFGAALARRLGLVAKVGVARENGARLLVGVFREVTEHHDNLVLHLEAGVAVVAEVLRLGHHQPITGEHHAPGGLDRIRERQGLDGRRTGEGLRAARVLGHRQRGAAVLRAGGERERHAEVSHARQRLGADALQLADDVVGGQLLTGRTREPPLELVGRQRFDLRPGARRCRCLRGSWSTCEEARDRNRDDDVFCICHV